MSSLVKSTATIGFYTLISRVLGFIRDVTIASSLGASWLSDAFFVAFKIPNFLRRLFAEGAFNAAFVPIFAGMLAADGKERAQTFANCIYSFLVCILLVVSVVCIAFMPWFLMVLAPGFSDDPAKYDLTVTLTQITFPYIIFISIVSLIGAMLNSVGKFAAVAATPILMNACLIIVPALIGSFTPTGAHALAIAVFVAGVVQMVWLIFVARKEGIAPKFMKPEKTPEVMRMLKLIGPAALGAGVAQINLFIDLIIASHIENGVSYLYYADRINELPLAVIGIAVGTVLLPTLSKHLRSAEWERASHLQNRAMEFALILALPAATALMVIAEPIIRLLYEHGEFHSEDSIKTAWALVAFAAGLPAFVLVKVLAPTFYAHQDTKTPVKIAIVCVLTNLFLNLALIGPFQHVGMAMATTCSGWLNVGMMLFVLKKRSWFNWEKKLLGHLPRLLAACVLMAAFLYGLYRWLAHYTVGSITEQAFVVSVMVLAGMACYGTALLLFKVVEPRAMLAYVKKK